MTTDGLPARRAAATALDRILRTGAYSNVLVPRTAIDPPSDHAYFQRLVYSTLRHLPGIDRAIAHASDRDPERIDRQVRSVLRVSVADLAVLDTDPHAAVNEGVAALHGTARRATGFVNAVLRRIAADDDVSTDALADAYPDSLVGMVIADLGETNGTSFLAAANEAAPIGLRFRPGGIEQGPRYATPDDAVGDLERMGIVDIIDPASSMVAEAAGAQPGERVLDLAAAPGGKTRALADAVGSEGLVVAVDVHDARLRRARRRSAALPQIHWVRSDGRRPPFPHGAFDRVLLDAPCTGLGTLRRRPEIRFRVGPDAPARYGALQRELLEAAIPLVRPGGRLVYSVCTPFRAETVDVVAGLGFRPPADVIAPAHGDGVLLGPDTTGTDGMFISVRDG